MSAVSDTRPLTPPPSSIDLRLGDKLRRLSYERASNVFAQLGSISDRGPQALIMQAFCEAAALHFDECSKPLVTSFESNRRALASELHNAFISYYVGIRQEAIDAMVKLVNEHRDLPTLPLLLGDMLQAIGQLAKSRKCWVLAVQRDFPQGAVALVAGLRLKKSTA